MLRLRCAALGAWLRTAEKLTVGVGSLLVGATALALLDMMRSFAAMAGVTLPSRNVFNQYASQVSGASPESQRSFAGTKALFMLLANQLYRHGAHILASFVSTLFISVTETHEIATVPADGRSIWMCALTVANLFVYALSSLHENILQPRR